MRGNPKVKLTANSEMTLGPKSASGFFLKSSIILMVINEQPSILTIGLN